VRQRKWIALRLRVLHTHTLTPPCDTRATESRLGKATCREGEAPDGPRAPRLGRSLALPARYHNLESALVSAQTHPKPDQPVAPRRRLLEARRGPAEARVIVPRAAAQDAHLAIRHVEIG